MSQQKTYELARINMEDAFSCQPLNDNADVVEDALNDLDAAKTSLTQKVTALGISHVAYGTYRAYGTTKVTLGFRPKVVFASSPTSVGRSGAFLEGSPNVATILSDGFQIKSTTSSTSCIALEGTTYVYLAIA